MWYLIITLFSVNPANSNTNGSIRAQVGKYEDCIHAKEQVIRTFKIENYRVNASCILLP